MTPICRTGGDEWIMNNDMCFGCVYFHNDDVIKWKHFPRYWPFVRGIHRWPVNSQHEGQWRGDLMYSLVCAWISRWVNNCEAGDLRRYRAHYDVIVMYMELAEYIHTCCMRGKTALSHMYVYVIFVHILPTLRTTYDLMMPKDVNFVDAIFLQKYHSL